MTNDKVIVKPALSSLDKWLELSAIACLAALWLYTIIKYPSLPEIIPAHYGIDGKVDRYGNKMFIWLLPAIVTIVFIGLSVLNKYPHLFNYTTTITPKNALQQYSLAIRLIRIIKLVVVVAFSFVNWKIINFQQPANSQLEWWFIPLLMLCLLAPTGYFIFKSSKMKA